MILPLPCSENRLQRGCVSVASAPSATISCAAQALRTALSWGHLSTLHTPAIQWVLLLLIGGMPTVEVELCPPDLYVEVLTPQDLRILIRD